MNQSIPDEVSGMRREPANVAAHRRYAMATWLMAAALLALAPWQVQWQAGKNWSHQPGLFSLVGVLGMLLFGVFELKQLWRQTAHARHASPRAELVLWTQALEFVVWFMSYVWLVPYLGYLFTTLAFALGMTCRLGYRQRVHMVSAVLVAVATVLVFKGALSVKVPAAAWYGWLPEPLATFFIQNL